MTLPRALLLCSFIAAVQCFAQSPDSIKDLKVLYETVARSYDFTSPTLEPWQLTATYQVFDSAGNFAGSGTYHFWWLSANVHRSTWTRGSAVESVWQTADGRKLQVSSGGPIHLFEIDFIRELLSPLPDPKNPLFGDTYFERQTRTFGGVKAPCINIVGRRTPHHTTPFPYAPPVAQIEYTFCFDPKLPVVVFGSTMMGTDYAYSDFVRTQDRYLPRSFVESINGRKLISVSVGSITALDPQDPALSPPADAKPDTDALVSAAPNDAYSHRISGSSIDYPKGSQGTVLLEVVITKDGDVRDAVPISSPDPALSAAAIESLSRWKFKPWLVDGHAVEVRAQMEWRFSRGP